MFYEFNIEALFPTPVLRTNINRKWTEREQFLFNYHRDFTHTNMGNTTSNDRYVLKAKEAKGLVEFIGHGIQYYVDNIICPKHPIEFFLTQSWLNYTKPGQFHHTHEHPNSILSGVLYIDANGEKDRINFNRSNSYRQIKINPLEQNRFNSDSWWLPVSTGDLIIFPSHFTHSVEIKEGENVRTSLSFNIFAKGYLGEEEELTALHL
jgi:uncharacterized protein (TIGR02466 family)